MRLPEGQLVRSRVITDPRTALVDALDRTLTGYAVLEPRDAVVLDGDGSGVLTFSGGVPVVGYHTGTGRGGPPALADLAAAGPYRLELVAAGSHQLARVHDLDRYRVPPGMPAERLAGDQDLAERTRDAAPAWRTERGGDRSAGGGDDGETDEAGDDEAGAGGGRPGAVEAFLEDEEKIEAIRDAAREEAKQRAEEWGFDV